MAMTCSMAYSSVPNGELAIDDNPIDRASTQDVSVGGCRFNVDAIELKLYISIYLSTTGLENTHRRFSLAIRDMRIHR